jgi:hypothetical protein
MTGTVLDLSALPDSARGEVIDFYEFLKTKYQSEKPVKDKINWSKLVPREVSPFKPMTRDEINER